MASEQFSLCWDNFHKNMSSGMNSLLENEDLVDVTLAVEGKYLKAHKMVLSVCSPYFKELFKTNPCKHPIVFMKDVSYVALSDLLQFMYQGEVQVSQENLTTFIKTAEALQIKGLTGDGNGSTDELNETHEERVSHTESAPIQVPRPKKIAPPPISTPPTKRQRTSASFESTPVHTPQIQPVQTKTEPISTPAPSTEQMIQFKMEPHEPQSMSMQDDNPEDTFGDEQIEDNNAEDAEEYSMMEGNEEEPQAGTSTETAGEGQGKNIVDEPKSILPLLKDLKEKNLLKPSINQKENKRSDIKPMRKSDPEPKVTEKRSKFEDLIAGLITLLENEKQAMSDADRLFLLSSVSALKRIPDVWKLTAKIELLKVIQSHSDLPTRVNQGGSTLLLPQYPVKKQDNGKLEPRPESGLSNVSSEEPETNPF